MTVETEVSLAAAEKLRQMEMMGGGQIKHSRRTLEAATGNERRPMVVTSS